ncbi:MAG: hypothetical protein AAGH41_01260 [Pseudomonadota bacterium]
MRSFVMMFAGACLAAAPAQAAITVFEFEAAITAVEGDGGPTVGFNDTVFIGDPVLVELEVDDAFDVLTEGEDALTADISIIPDPGGQSLAQALVQGCCSDIPDTDASDGAFGLSGFLAGFTARSFVDEDFFLFAEDFELTFDVGAAAPSGPFMSTADLIGFLETADLSVSGFVSGTFFDPVNDVGFAQTLRFESVTQPVPVPGAAVLMLGGLTTFAASRKKRRS